MKRCSTPARWQQSSTQNERRHCITRVSTMFLGARICFFLKQFCIILFVDCTTARSTSACATLIPRLLQCGAALDARDERGYFTNTLFLRIDRKCVCLASQQRDATTASVLERLHCRGAGAVGARRVARDYFDRRRIGAALCGSRRVSVCIC